MIQIISVALEIHGAKIGSFQAGRPKVRDPWKAIKNRNIYARLVIKCK
jgi:hypothetical protein